MIAALLTLLVSAVDPCTAPIPPGTGDPREAQVYVRVGDAERARGNLGAAREAYRAALARAPASVEARRGLEAACAPVADPVQAGADALEAGDPEGALRALAGARGAGNDHAVDLLEGIARYQLGQDTIAVPLLEAARSDPRDRTVGVVLPRPHRAPPRRRRPGQPPLRPGRPRRRPGGRRAPARAHGPAGRSRRRIRAGRAGLRHERGAPARRRAHHPARTRRERRADAPGAPPALGTPGPYLRAEGSSRSSSP
jgi:hypothetical protein